jgi:hypothetical protein
MTPELKTACELVFQEHKLSAQPIKWSRDAFRGRISIGLSEMAKETLVKKNIILWPDKSKKVFTKLNPDVASARSFEEAEQMIEKKIPALAVMPAINDGFNVADLASQIESVPPKPAARTYHMLKVVPATEPNVTEINWWMKPLYLYVIWPVCGAVAGVLISMLMNLVYHALF